MRATVASGCAWPGVAARRTYGAARRGVDLVVDVAASGGDAVDLLSQHLTGEGQLGAGVYDASDVGPVRAEHCLEVSQGLVEGLSLIHISEPTRLLRRSRMPSSA